MLTRWEGNWTFISPSGVTSGHVHKPSYTALKVVVLRAAAASLARLPDDEADVMSGYWNRLRVELERTAEPAAAAGRWRYDDGNWATVTLTRTT
ncbi:hypothetical protein ACVW0K_007233 [Streptomyces filamentosus]|uniref:hypothetical protein n=1 Tax=Streptomyces filamentosus TaxID=67294 RepID=UPI0036E00D12